jgi:predicted anti-sigma-YlaC factor YlaD
MKHQHPAEVLHQICDQMGENLDVPFCKEVSDHLRECPNCRIHFDTVKQTVVLCREMEEYKELPPEMSKRLLKILHLDKTT